MKTGKINTGSAELKNVGLKVTLPRLKVLEILAVAIEEGKHHLTAEEVYLQLNEAGEEVGLATVYRVLTQFEEAGLVLKHFFDGGQSVFELNLGDNHGHIVCVGCGRIDEYSHPTGEDEFKNLAAKHGYVLQDYRTVLYGLCQKCQNKK